MNADLNKSNHTIFAHPVVTDEPEPPVWNRAARSSHTLAFTMVFAFTLLLYIRPNELLPDVFGDIPLAKIVAITGLLAFVLSSLVRGESLTIWPVELKMISVILLLSIIFVPIAMSPAESISTLSEAMLKVVAIFVLIINVVNTWKRLLSMIKLVVISGTLIALSAIHIYLAGAQKQEDKFDGERIVGLIGGIFGNPNDLAMALNLLVPLAVVLALKNRGLARMGYFACSAALAAGVVVTFSRGGFLGLVAMGVALLLKIGRGNRLLTATAALLAVGIFVTAMPSGYSDRLFSIFQAKQDITGSSQERQDLLKRAIDVASRHLVLGVGIGNYRYYSLRNKAAHNSYLEISAELGAIGLVAYLVLIFAPLRSMKRIERKTARRSNAHERNTHYLAVGIQAAIVSYIVCSFFGSVQYMWFIYYPIAFAVALRKLCPEAESAAETSVRPALQPAAEGTLWSAR